MLCPEVAQEKFLPILIKNVFKQVLWKLPIFPIFSVWQRQTGKQLLWPVTTHCPVLSNDSDFYIFSTQGGFLPIIHFQWRKVSHCKSDTKKLNPCQMVWF